MKGSPALLLSGGGAGFSSEMSGRVSVVEQRPAGVRGQELSLGPVGAGDRTCQHC